MEEALGAAQRAGPDWQANVRVNLSQTAALMGDNERAIAEGERCLTYARRSTHRRLHLPALINLLAALTEAGYLAGANRLLEEAVPLRQYVDPGTREGFELEEAALLCELGHSDEARPTLERLSHSGGVAASGAALVLGLVAMERGDKWATDWLRTAADKLPYPVLRARARALLARAFALGSDSRQAERYLESIGTDALASAMVQREVALARGALARSRHDLTAASEELELAVRVARRQPARIREIEALLELAEITDELDDAPRSEILRHDAAMIAVTVARDLNEPETREVFLSRPAMRPIRHEVEKRLRGA
jgi:hypothetical protein